MRGNEFLGSVEKEGVAIERGKDSEIPHEICINDRGTKNKGKTLLGERDVGGGCW